MKTWESAPLSFWTIYRDGDGFRLVKSVFGAARLSVEEGDEFPTLEDARLAVPPDLLRIPRLANDDPAIIEVWL